MMWNTKHWFIFLGLAVSLAGCCEEDCSYFAFTDEEIATVPHELGELLIYENGTGGFRIFQVVALDKSTGGDPCTNSDNGGCYAKLNQSIAELKGGGDIVSGQGSYFWQKELYRGSSWRTTSFMDVTLKIGSGISIYSTSYGEYWGVEAIPLAYSSESSNAYRVTLDTSQEYDHEPQLQEMIYHRHRGFVQFTTYNPETTWTLRE